MEIVAVGDENITLLFQLLGLRVFIFEDYSKQEFEDHFNELLRDKNIGLIIMNGKYLMRHKKYFRQIKTRKLPIIVEVPDLISPVAKDYYEDFIKKYIGVLY